MTLARRLAALVVLAAVPLLAAVKSKQKSAAPEPAPYDQAQPTVEKLDLTMYQRIREEGLQHSHVMEFASALTDGIGGRLTGSPNMQRANEWTRDELTRLGMANAHMESWGEFGMGWQQINTWVRMVAPDTAPLIAQATPWSPGTNGPVSGEAVQVIIENEKDLDKYRGKLSGKVVLLGALREVGVVDKPLFERYTEKDLAELAQAEENQRPRMRNIRAFVERAQLREKVANFLADEKAAAVVTPSRDSSNHGGSGGTFFDDNGAALGVFSYKREHAVRVPVVVMAIEHYGRLTRLVEARVPVTLEVNVETKFTGDHEQGFDTVAEIPGTDPNLKEQVVMVGGHLDSWASATGATDNGAGTVVAMEVMRILKALDVQPRRTVRITLWSGEEQGLFGSRGYVKQHFGSAPLSTAPDQMNLPDFLRKAAGPLELKPEWKTLDGYFNLDNGSGKVRGIYLQGNAAIEPVFEQWMAPLKDLGVSTITMRNTGGTDHLSFDAVGLPGFQFIQDPLDYDTRTHHSNMDLYERLQPGDLAQAATVEAIFVYNTAMRDQMLPRKPLPHPELEEKRDAPVPDVMPGAKPAPPNAEPPA